MLTKCSFLAAAILVFSLSVPAAAYGERAELQLNEQAVLLGDTVPTSDPCVVASFGGEVIDFLSPRLEDEGSFFVGTTNICTGERLHDVATSLISLSESDFVYHGHDHGHFSATLPAIDSALGVETTLAVDLVWTSIRGVSDPFFVVTGTLSSGDMLVTLDESIKWNPWGQFNPPQAVMRPCRFVLDVGPGCFGGSP